MSLNHCYSRTIAVECRMEANNSLCGISIVRSWWNKWSSIKMHQTISSIVLWCFRAEQMWSWHLLHRQLTFDLGFITHVRTLNLALCPGSLKDTLQRVCLILLLFDNPNSQRMTEYFRAQKYGWPASQEPVWKSFEHVDLIVTWPNDSSSSKFPPLTT